MKGRMCEFGLRPLYVRRNRVAVRSDQRKTLLIQAYHEVIMRISVKFSHAVKTSLAAAFAAIALTAPAFAAEPEIVVEGQRKQLSAQLKQLFNESSSGQLGRFEESVCPAVIGFPAEWTGILDGLLRKNISAAGLKVQDTGCRPNALLIFIDDPQAVVQGLYEAQPDFFGVMSPAKYHELSDAKRPVYSWHVIEQRSRDGVALNSVSGIGNGSGASSPVGSSGAKIVRNAAATRLYNNVREDMLLSFAIIDKPQTQGKTLRQLADLATMHLLLDIQPGAKASGDSILSLFDNGDANTATPNGDGVNIALPERMSDLDKRTVAGLYAIPGNNYNAATQRDRIAARITKDRKNEDALTTAIDDQEK
jgi:hypothetical protein